MSFEHEYSEEHFATSERSGSESDVREISRSGIQPYLFEPEWPSDDECLSREPAENQQFNHVEDEPRQINLDWYVKSHCFGSLIIHFDLK